MKKFLSCVAIFVFAVVLTGCGKKSLTCEGDMTQSGITAGVKVTGDFKGDKLVKQTIKMEFDLTNFLQYADIDTYYDSFKTEYGKFDEYDGISTKVEKGESSIIVTVEMDLEKVDDKAYKELNLGSGNVEVSAKQFQSEFEDMGLTCK